jgi:hypothetical protein
MNRTVMSQGVEERSQPAGQTRGPDLREREKRRLEQALRENLRRRKEQARLRRQSADLGPKD